MLERKGNISRCGGSPEVGGMLVLLQPKTTRFSHLNLSVMYIIQDNLSRVAMLVLLQAKSAR